MYERVLIPTDGSETAETAVEETLDFAADADVGLSVMGSYDRNSVRRLRLGSVTERVLRSTYGSVLVADEREDE